MWHGMSHDGKAALDASKSSGFRHVLHQSYSFLYIVGVQTVRIFKKTFRKLKHFFRPVVKLGKQFYQWAIGKRIIEAKEEYCKIREGLRDGRRKIALARRKSRGRALAESSKIFWTGLWHHKKVFATVFNIVAPVAGIAVLCITIQHWNNMNFALKLEYGGEYIGYVQNENVYDEATNLVTGRVVGDVTQLDNDAAPAFTLAAVDSEKYVTASNVCDKIIQTSSGVIEEATGLYIDGEFVASLKSTTDMKFILQSILNSYKTDQEGAEVTFAKDVEMIQGLYPQESIITAEAMKNLLTAQTETAEYYTVRAGDSPLSIADKCSMSYSELVNMNPEKDFSVIHEGDQLQVSTAKSFLTVSVTKEETYTKTVPYETVKEQTDTLYVGSTKVEVEGSDGEVQYVDKVEYVDGMEISRENISTVTVKEAVDKKILVGTKKKATVTTSTKPSGGGSSSTITQSTQPSSGIYMSPVPSAIGISQYYGYNRGHFHGGIDYMASVGTPIYAADAGTVISAGWHAGYGWNMKIRHDNGQVTFYAHCNSLAVASGSRVSKGQPIARVGRTGYWATGPHLHFEVLVGGRQVNPLNYVR